MQEGFSRIRLDPTSADRFQSIRRELGVTTFGANLMALGPGQRGRIHRHRVQEEAYLVLEGTLTLAIEGVDHELGPFEAARVAPGLRRQVVNQTHERVLFVALGGSAEHVGRDAEAFESWDDHEGRPPADVPMPADLARSCCRRSLGERRRATAPWRPCRP